MIRRSILCLAFLFLACAKPAPEKIKEDKQLYDIGNDSFERKKYSDAIPYLLELKNRFSDSQYAIDSELKLADSYFLTKDYINAQIEYESFRTLHPTHPQVPYTYLQIGKCLLYQAPSSVQKDQAETESALITLNDLIQRWPASVEAQQAKEFIDKGEDKLARKQLYVAKFYISQKIYPPAIRRLEALNSDRTPQYLRREALYRLGLVHLTLGHRDIAQVAFERLVSDDIHDKYEKPAQRQLALLKNNSK